MSELNKPLSTADVLKEVYDFNAELLKRKYALTHEQVFGFSTDISDDVIHCTTIVGLDAPAYWILWKGGVATLVIGNKYTLLGCRNANIMSESVATRLITAIVDGEKGELYNTTMLAMCDGSRINYISAVRYNEDLQFDLSCDASDIDAVIAELGSYVTINGDTSHGDSYSVESSNNDLEHTDVLSIRPSKLIGCMDLLILDLHSDNFYVKVVKY